VASNVLSKNPYSFSGDERPSRATAVEPLWRRILKPVASLKLTIVLFSLAIFIILAGTVAQIDMDVWQVVHHYFRAFFTWIPLRIFFPRVSSDGTPIYIPGGFPFPGLWTVGAVACVNLLAAHILRFKAQAKGLRLVSGLVVIAVGVGLTTWVIAGVGTVPWSALWVGIKLAVAALLAGAIYRLVTMDWSRRLEAGFLVVGTIILASVLTWLLVASDFVPADPSMRILWQLVQAGGAAVVSLIGCFLAFRKRAGIVLLHAGVILMMVNELFVGLQNEGYFIQGAAEAEMQLQVGDVHDYVEDVRAVEFAVIDPSNAKTDSVTVVPKRILLAGGTVRNEQLPFDLKLVKFFQNSILLSQIPPEKRTEALLSHVPPKVPNPATAGPGLSDFPIQRPPGTGVDSDSKVDQSSAYVELLKKGSSDTLGTYLVSTGMLPQNVTVDGKTYQFDLRFQRTYKPYTVALSKTQEIFYPGTKMAKGYESYIHLSDPTTNTNRDAKIWMNNPLRHHGETFYQSGFVPGGDGRSPTTVLMVVANRGWMIPYTGCMIVVVGLLAQFLMVLVRFLRRQSAEMAVQSAGGELPFEVSPAARSRNIPAGAARPARRPTVETPLTVPTGWSATLGEFFPWVVVAIFVGYAASKAITPSTSTTAMNLYQFGELPVQYGGRLVPMDTLARTSLMAVSDKQTFISHANGDAKGKTRPAIVWLLDVITDSPDAETDQVFKFDNPEIVELLHLPWTESHRYALKDFEKYLPELDKQAKLADAVEKGSRSVFQKKVLEAYNRVNTLSMLQGAFRGLQFPMMPTEEDLKKDPEAATETAAEIRRLLKLIPAFHKQLHDFALPAAVPVDATAERESLGDKAAKKPADEQPEWKWESFAEAVDIAYVERTILGREPAPATLSLAGIFHAYLHNDPAKFNVEVAKYRVALAADPPGSLDVGKTDFEAFFNHAEPFYYGLILYVVAFVLACIGFLGWRVPLHRAAFWLIVATLVIHTAALIGRIYISGRPPVTNLYSAAVFIGWAGVLLGLVLEVVYRLGVGILVSSVAGFAGLLIAQLLAASGDTMAVPEAVLDTQFWLATHVVCVTLGYATTFVAGVLGIIYLFESFFAHDFNAADSKKLARMIYGVVCFAIFFSFFGTVLGGLWADDSWGRFWGWDPKENGALIIVIWNALVLHARWDGLVKDRGLAMLAIGGNIAVAWSMFGVNELGVGLHSYGFTEGVKLALILFVASQLALIAAGAIFKRNRNELPSASRLAAEQ
jgi:ABC-type transport system involved in cytochrome c biogenesis permease subunit